VKSEILSHLDFIDRNVCVDCNKSMQTSHSWYTLIFVVPLTFLLGVVKNISFFIDDFSCYWFYICCMKYFILFIDDFSCYCYQYLAASMCFVNGWKGNLIGK
jgi:hypothetical protein